MTSKAVLTFGVRGGRISGQRVLCIKAASEMARDLVWVLGGVSIPAPVDWRVSTKRPHLSWQSDTHYVSVQLLTGTGDRSSALWGKP